MAYPIIKIQDYEKLEQMGSKEKFWYHDRVDKKNKLFKIGRPGTGENWSEKVTSEIAQTLGLPCAQYDFAIWGDKQGVTSPIFVPENGRLVHGNELLAKIIKDYPEKPTYHIREYRISTVVAALQIFKERTLLPMGYVGNDVIKKPLDVFIGYLMFDCLISNPDRHHENWGFVVDYVGKKVYLAPTYDHASGLGCRVSDDEIKRRRETTDNRYTVEAFVAKAKSAFSFKDGKRISPLMAFIYAAKKNVDAAIYWLDKIEKLSLASIVDIFNEVPMHLITKDSILFAVDILNANRLRLIQTKEFLKND